MMEKKYQLVAWTSNVADEEKARLYMVPSVELELLEPLFAEVAECRKEQEKAGGYLSPKLARRFIRVYERSARLDILTGNIDHAIRFLLQAAEYCIHEDSFNWAYYDTDLGSYSYFCGELRYKFEMLCEEAISLARKHGFEYVLKEKRPSQTLDTYLEHTQEERDLKHYRQKSQGKPD